MKNYIHKLNAKLATGDATEHTHRPALQSLFEELAPDLLIINEPKRIAVGAPDFTIRRKLRGGQSLAVGYVETKDIGADLDELLKSEQLKRYLPLGNLLFTDYLEFRWYVDGKLRTAARLASISPPVYGGTKGGSPIAVYGGTKGGSPIAVHGGTKGGSPIAVYGGTKGGLRLLKDGEEQVRELLVGFLTHEPLPISSPQELAKRMAALCRQIDRIIVTAFKEKQASQLLDGLKEAFERTLLPELLPEQFADMFAQTLAYGLFAARIHHERETPGQPFTRYRAAREIPKTNPFLRNLFETITGTQLDEEPFVGFVDDLTDLMNYADLGEILKHFGKRTGQQDAVVHFYETFLAAYDPKLRELRGVYYTPEPVVSYIVRSVDILLKEKFGLKDGLADRSTVEVEVEENGEKVKKTLPKVLILDPACGTGTFLYAVIDLIRTRFMESGNAGEWSDFVRDHLLKRIYGFELLMAPYAVAHLKLAMQLSGHDLEEPLRSQWAYDFKSDERLNIFLTNSLEMTDKYVQTALFGMEKTIAEEANAAHSIKADLPIMVVLGNPPYSGHSANKNPWIEKLVRDYYFVDGQPLGERNPKWLQDDYVKFIRFGQWRIDRTGHGILAYISNHGYLDNPTFRGMRQNLMNSFDELYLLDLHGNAKKKEKAPDGGKDENVFDIQQGVAIGIFVKGPTPPDPRGRQTPPNPSVNGGGLESGLPPLAGGIRGVGKSVSWEDVPPGHWQYAREMRKEPSAAEKKLWQVLRGGRLGTDFRRQHPIGPFIADFYVSDVNLVIEVDGDTHATPEAAEYDQARDEYMRERGLRVLRFTNNDVLKSLDGVVEEIRAQVSQTPPNSPEQQTPPNPGISEQTPPNPPVNGGGSESGLPPLAGGIRGVGKSDVFGLRRTKYDWLLGHDLRKTEWQDPRPEKPHYLFMVRDTEQGAEWEAGWKINEAMPVNSAGIVTARDDLSIGWTKKEIIDRVRDFAALDPEEARSKYALGADVRDWRVKWAQEDIAVHSAIEDLVEPILYRPFDTRYTYYTGHTRGFICMPRAEVMQHLLIGQNVALVTVRQVAEGVFDHVLCSRWLVDNRFTRSNKGICYVHPLFVTQSSGGARRGNRRRPNLSPAFIEEFSGKLGLKFVEDGRGDLGKTPLLSPRKRGESEQTPPNPPVNGGESESGLPPPAGGIRGVGTFGPEDIFDYIYAVFHCPTYRTRYAEFLKIDFPRVPLTSNVALFRKLVKLGGRLVKLHLLEFDPETPPYPAASQTPPNPPVNGGESESGLPPPAGGQRGVGSGTEGGSRVSISYPARGDHTVEKVRYVDKERQVWINGKQYFEGVPPDVWEFHIGGYQVAEKWLKDRKGRTLSSEDREHYRKIIAALRETIHLMKEIDAAIPAWPIE